MALKVARESRREDQSESARERIIVAAESLFAERGIEGVSLREIAIAAQNGNNNAVQYHFGSKEALIAAIFAFRVAQMEEERRERLQRAEARGLLNDALTLVETMCVPYLALTDSSGAHSYAAFLTQYITRYRPMGMPHAVDFETRETSVQRRLLSLIEKRIDFVPYEIGQSRITLVGAMFGNMLVRYDRSKPEVQATLKLETLVRDTIEMGAHALCLPFRG